MISGGWLLYGTVNDPQIMFVSSLSVILTSQRRYSQFNVSCAKINSLIILSVFSVTFKKNYSLPLKRPIKCPKGLIICTIGLVCLLLPRSSFDKAINIKIRCAISNNPTYSCRFWATELEHYNQG